MNARVNYKARAGTLAARVIEHLQANDAGTYFTRDAIVQEFGANPASVSTLLRKACAAGVLTLSKFQSEGGGWTYGWQLAEPPEPEGPREHVPLSIGAFSDGDFVVEGCAIKGNQATFTLRQLQELVEFASTPFVQRAHAPIAEEPAA